MKSIFINIKQLIQVWDTPPQWLAGNTMAKLPVIEDAWLWVEADTIIAYGRMASCPNTTEFEVIDCDGQLILPTWYDSHTHLIFAAPREGEFVDRINGLTYQEIAAKGGGILNSAKKLQNTPINVLFKEASKRLESLILKGTGAIEIKSGYGLTLEAELKMLKVAKKLKDNYELPIKITFLGAHAIPQEFKSNPQDYVNYICHTMLPEVGALGYVDFVDVFCEDGYFSVADTQRILNAAKPYNLTPKIHVNQFNILGGVAEAVKQNALSVDHLEVLNKADIEALKNSKTMPVALPGCSFFLGLPYTPAREILNAELPLALATDYNPGSAPSGNMSFTVSLACIKMQLTPEEAINAATLNGAYALNIQDKYGSITPGKKANFMITKPLTSYAYIPYAFGENCIDTVYCNGKKQSFD